MEEDSVLGLSLDFTRLVEFLRKRSETPPERAAADENPLVTAEAFSFFNTEHLNLAGPMTAVRLPAQIEGKSPELSLGYVWKQLRIMSFARGAHSVVLLWGVFSEDVLRGLLLGQAFGYCHVTDEHRLRGLWLGDFKKSEE